LSKEQTNWETDIRLIQSDIKQIQKFFNKVESSMELMVDLSKNVAVQSEVIAFTKEKLEEIERTVDETRRNEDLRLQVLSDRLEEYRRSSRGDHEKLAQHNAEKRAMSNKEILEKLEIMERGLHSRINDQNKKVNALENWKYYMMGIGGVIVLLVARINWPYLFN
jgi:phosphoenolpyruvate carboxylase